jgi:hypothetical protein
MPHPKVKHGVRRLRSRGWGLADIAAIYGLSTREVKAILSPPAAPRPKPPRPPRPPKWIDQWKQCGDWRYQNDVPDPETPPADPPRVPELLDVAGAAEIAAELLEQPAPEPWTGPVDFRWHGPRKITPAVLAEALELRAKGWTWPDIAEWFGVSRMGLYYAVRRPPA